MREMVAAAGRRTASPFDATHALRHAWLRAEHAISPRATLPRRDRSAASARSQPIANRTKSPAMKPLQRVLPAMLGIAAISCMARLHAEPVTVRYAEGVTRGFLVMRTTDGKDIASGDLSQVVKGDRVSRRLVFRFKDGSIQDESVVLSQRGTFRLLNDHIVQKGPSFPQPMDVTINVASGQITVRYTDDDGKQQVINERVALPNDLANGMLPTLMRNLGPGSATTTWSYVAATPKPRIVKLEVSAAGEDPFTAGGMNLKATRFVVKVKLGGVAGLVAPLLDKQPPDSYVWVVGGDAPSFVKAETPLYTGGPMTRLELVSPSWP